MRGALFVLFVAFVLTCKKDPSEIDPYDKTFDLPTCFKNDYVVLQPSRNLTAPIQHIKLNVRRFNQPVSGNIHIYPGFAGRFSVLPPRLGCARREKTSVTARYGGRTECKVAYNQGFFSSTACIGNVISNGTSVQVVDSPNSNFGILKNGSVVIGYMKKDTIQRLNFQQLATGIIWLVRNGKSYVKESFEFEKPNPNFITLLAPRVGWGINKNGDLFMIQVDGYLGAFGQPGLNLHQFSELAIEFGAHYLINMDGGGSSTVVEYSKILSKCTDQCSPNDLPNQCPNTPKGRCERRVTTIGCLN